MSVITEELLMSEVSGCTNPQILLSKDNIAPDLLAKIPPSWWSLLTLNPKTINHEAIRELWKPTHNLITNLMEEIQNRLHGMAILLEDGYPPSLLYIFLFKSQKLGIYRGFPPIAKEELPNTAKTLPIEFTEFYTKTHNGWYDLFSESAGPTPADAWFRLDPDDWGLDEETVESIPYPPNKILLVYSDGSDGYLGFLLQGKTKAKPLLLYVDDLENLMTDISFWDEVDVALSGQFQDFITV